MQYCKLTYFAENHTIKSQNKVQNENFQHSQCTIFTAYVWTSEGEESLGLVSDYNTHNNTSVFKYMDFLTDLKEKDVFSDGCAAQFKQCYLLSNLDVFELKYGLKIRWHFFASGHGKGIGAIWRRCAAGIIVATGKEVAALALPSSMWLPRRSWGMRMTCKFTGKAWQASLAPSATTASLQPAPMRLRPVRSLRVPSAGFSL